MDIVAVQQAHAQLAKALRAQGNWSVVSMKSAAHVSTKAAFSANQSQTVRIAQILPTAVSGLRVGVHSWYQSGTGESPFPSSFFVKAEIQILPTGQALNESNSSNPTIPLTFGGKVFAHLKGARFLLSDPVLVSLPAGTVYFVKCYVVGSLLAAPAAPTLATATTGGALVAATYKVALTYVYPDGTESAASPSTSQVTTGSTSTITVTAPTAATGALGYRVYAASSIYATSPATDSGVMAFGTNYVWTQAPNAGPQPVRDGVIAGQAGTFPIGMSIAGGTSTDAVNNGEGFLDNVDRTGEGIAINPNSSTSVFAPTVVLGLTPDAVVKSLGLMGDSKMAATADYSFIGRANWGGYGVRACLGQFASRVHNPATVPLIGHVFAAVGGDRIATFVTDQGQRRTQLLSLATTVLCNYAINDISNGDPATLILANLLTAAALFTGQKRKFIQTTIEPKATSTDGWRTVTNQKYSSALQEGHRRQLNAMLLKAGGQSTVTTEALYGAYAGTPGPSTNFYGGGNGTATVFLTRQMFAQGSEAVQVAGVAKALTTDYTYVGAQTIGGVAYAAGVTFLSAPANAATVTASYTAGAGFRSLGGPLTDIIDIASAVECDSGGTAGTGGGWWAPDTSTVRDTGTASASASTTLTDSSKAWTVNGHRGYSVRIVTDTTTPAAVGQVAVIAYNTATVLSFAAAWPVTPSSVATYQIADSPTQEGTHPSPRSHMAMAALIDLSKVI